MIYLWFLFLWFLGFPLFFIDFPKEFLEIFDFSLIFLEFFLKSLIFWMIWIYFFEFSLGISWNFLEIIKKIINKSLKNHKIYDLFMIFLWFIYDFFLIFGISFIFHWFSEGIFGNLWFFIDFPRVFLEILDFLNDLNLFFWIFLRNFMEFPWNHKKIINKP